MAIEVDIEEVIEPVVSAWERLLEANQEHYDTVMEKFSELADKVPPEDATEEQVVAFYDALQLIVAAIANQLPANSEFRVGVDQLIEVTQTETGGIKIGAAVGLTEFEYISEDAVVMHSANSFRVEIASATGELLSQAVSAIIGDENLAMILQALQGLMEETPPEE